LIRNTQNEQYRRSPSACITAPFQSTTSITKEPKNKIKKLKPLSTNIQSLNGGITEKRLRHGKEGLAGEWSEQLEP
ncbi:MAG: hypothetical protein KC944_20285, partial [Candidatus Omnitrophica bacterium]|nr:hypothetical protein [Candidatus Omnitrophota bacterium]